MSPWIETQRSAVRSWDADELGHMNVQHYIGRFSDAAVAGMAALGLTPEVMRETRRGIATVRQRVRFLHELRVGDFLHVETGVFSIGQKSLGLIHRMYDDSTGEIAATQEQTVVVLDLEARRGLTLPEEIRGKVDAHRVDWSDRAPEFPPMPEAPGMRDTYLGTVQAWELDAMGHQTLQFYITKFSMASDRLLFEAGLNRQMMETSGMSQAALDYLIEYRREARVADLLRVKSAVTELGTKSFKLCHRMLDAVTGELCATLQVVSVLFNTRTRRGEPIPPAMRAKAQGLMVPR